jgi:hypothetical protein
MRLPKPLYEALPLYYVAIGVIALLARLYVNYWYWPLICTVVGIGGLLAGGWVWLKRRDYRLSRGPSGGSRRDPS